MKNQNQLNNEQQIDKANHTLALFLFNYTINPAIKIFLIWLLIYIFFDISIFWVIGGYIVFKIIKNIYTYYKNGNK